MMWNLRRHRKHARLTAALWAFVGLLGGLIALTTMLQLAEIGGYLPNWLPFMGAGKGSLLLGFIVGVSLGCLSLWEIYLQTIHGKETTF